MVKIYREKVSPQADAIEAELQDMIFGYDREIMDAAVATEKFGPGHSLPVITNNEKVVSGKEIPAYIRELRRLMNDWQAFQGDSCYVNEPGRELLKEYGDLIQLLLFDHRHFSIFGRIADHQQEERPAVCLDVKNIVQKAHRAGCRISLGPPGGSISLS